MSKRIFTFERNGQKFLGFDTGLDAQSFAQAKLARLLTGAGSIVYPDGKIVSWLPGGVSEAETMIVWGPPFPGEELTGLVSDTGRKDEALNAIRFWLKARIILEKNKNIQNETQSPDPAGVFIATKVSTDFPIGAVFFPPQLLLQRTIETEETIPEAGWVHADLRGNEAISFCAGLMLYSVFCGAHPFGGNNIEQIRQDIREGVFTPSELAAPGLDPEMAELINTAIGRSGKGTKGKKPRPLPSLMNDYLGRPAAGTVSSWQKKLSEEETTNILSAGEQYRKKTTRKIKTRRFVVRNITIIALLIIALTAALFAIHVINKRRSEMPGTAGMNPAEVAQLYYNSFNDLNHTMMDACVRGKAGKQDIDMVTGLYVVTKARQAYELTSEIFIPAPRWIEEGRPETNKIVFGITDLKTRILSADDKIVYLEASYILWISLEGPGEGQAVKDTLELACSRDSWHITKIERVKAGEISQ